LRIFVATSAAVADRSGAAAADVGDVAADVPPPPPLEQLGSPTTLIATSIRLALLHLMVNIEASECQEFVSCLG